MQYWIACIDPVAPTGRNAFPPMLYNSCEMGTPPGIREGDLVFAQLVVDQGIAKHEEVQDCLRLLEQLAAAGASPIPSLGELLVRKGFLTPNQVERTLRLPHAPRSSLSLSQEKELPPEAAEGERVGKYLKTRKLGEGGMGEVWKAWDVELRRWVALKFLKSRDAEELARFKREAQTAAKLQHPNIAAVYEAAENYIAMQFVEGQTLESFPRDDKRALAEVMTQAALAVQFAHENGVIHRDLKPGNIMVVGGKRAGTARRGSNTPRATQVQAFVMDFGLAKSMNVDSKLSVSGMIAGTPAYMSPEQARGSSKLDPRTDVYSLGATLYELLADRPPFRSDDVYGLLKKVIEEDPCPPGGDRDLRTIVMKCLEKDPARRYGTALEVADELSRFLEGEAILAHPPSTLYRIKKAVQRNRVITMVAMISAIAVFLAGYFAFAKYEERQRIAAENERERKRAEASKAEANKERQRVDSILHSLLEDIGSYYNEALTARRAGEPHAALVKIPRRVRESSLYRQIKSEAGRNAQVRYSFGVMYRAIGEDDAARKELEAAIELNPQHGSAQYELGLMLFREYRRMIDERREEWRRKESERRFRISGGAPITGDLKPPEDKELQTDEAKGVRARAVKSISIALLHLERTSAEFLTAQAMIAIDELRTQEAIDRLREALERDMAFEDAVLILAGVYPTVGRLQEALRILSEALKIDRGNLNLYRESARLNASLAQMEWFKGGRPDPPTREAAAQYSRIIELHPEDSNAFRARGALWAHAARGKRESGADSSQETLDALRDLTRAIELNLQGSAAYAERGCVWSSVASAKSQTGVDASQEAGWAMADLDKAIQLNPANVEALRFRGNLWNLAGQAQMKAGMDPESAYGRARDDFDRAISLDATDAETWLTRGLLWMNWAECLGQSGKNPGEAYKNSERDFDQTIKLLPDFFEQWMCRGGLFVNWGNFKSRSGQDPSREFDHAQRDLDQAVRLGASDPETRHFMAKLSFGRARHYESRHEFTKAAENYDAAAEHLEKAIALRPSLGSPLRRLAEEARAKAKALRK